jgi:hypothetical protein
MTRDKLNEILQAHFMPMFPDTASYIRSRTEETRNAWAKLFESQEPRDLIAACVMLQTGDLDPLPAYEREQFGVWMLRACKTARIERMRAEMKRQNEHQARQREALRAERGGSLADGVTQMLERAGLGRSFRKILQLQLAAKRGEITDDECQRRRWEIIDEVQAGVR